MGARGGKVDDIPKARQKERQTDLTGCERKAYPFRFRFRFLFLPSAGVLLMNNTAAPTLCLSLTHTYLYYTIVHRSTFTSTAKT